MATNRVYEDGSQLSVAATDPATPASGDPLLHGQVPGVALTDERSDGTTTAQFDGVFNLSVKGQHFNGTALANIAVAVGDLVYYTAGRTPVLDKDNRGVRYGYVLAPVASGATSTIPVKVGY